MSHIVELLVVLLKHESIGQGTKNLQDTTNIKVVEVVDYHLGNTKRNRGFLLSMPVLAALREHLPLLRRYPTRTIKSDCQYQGTECTVYQSA